MKPNGLNKIAAIKLAPGEKEDFYTIKSAWVGRPAYIEKFGLLWERSVPVAAAPGKAPSFSSSPQRPEKGTPDAEGQSNVSDENIIFLEEKGKPKYAIRAASREQETIDAYRERYLAPAEPREPRNVVATAKGIKDRLTERAQKFYEQVVDRWGSWESLERRAVKAGAKIPFGELVTTSLSYMRGAEGRVRQGIIGDYVYQDRQAFDEALGQWPHGPLPRGDSGRPTASLRHPWAHLTPYQLTTLLFGHLPVLLDHLLSPIPVSKKPDSPHQYLLDEP